MASFGLVSSQTQYLLCSLLSDKNFVKTYISENKKRLKARQGMLVKELKNAGINCLKSNAGLFCWVDMRHMLSSRSFGAEMELWKKIVHDVGLNISPGSSCHCSEPGWFRVCFANMPAQTLELAMRRLRRFVASTRAGSRCRGHDECSNKNFGRKLLPKWVFQLSFRDRENER